MQHLFVLTLIFVFLTISIESFLFLIQINGKKVTKWFGNKDFLIHSLITLFFWISTSILIILLQFEVHPIFHNELILRIIGLILLIIGLIISVWGYYILGLNRSLGLNFYRDNVPIVKSSIYKYIKNPEDYGFWLILFGIALLTGSIYNLSIAIEFTVLMIPHQKLENIPLKKII